MAQQNQRKSIPLEEILRSDRVQELDIGKCVAAGEKGDMMVCRTDENEYIAEGRGLKFRGKIEGQS